MNDFKQALTTKTIFTRGENVVTSMNTEVAMDVRDAFVKGVYGRMFIWLVKKLNVTIFKPQEGFRKSIGVLDIFGFENFGKNRLFHKIFFHSFDFFTHMTLQLIF